MKEYSIFLGGKDRPLKYKLADRIEIERRFSANGVPGDIFKLLGAIQPQGSLEVFVTILWVGLRHADKKLTPDKVLEMLEARFAEDGATRAELIRETYNPVLWAVGASGILGWNASIQFEDEVDVPPEEDAEGKAPRRIRAVGEY